MAKPNCLHADDDIDEALESGAAGDGDEGCDCRGG